MIEAIFLMSITSSRILSIEDKLLERKVRPQLNFFIKKPFGYGFTTMATELQEKGYVNYVNDFTVPGLVGTVKGSHIYKGILCNSGYKSTVIDEVMMLDSKSKKAILEITEQGSVTRTLQGFVESRREIDIPSGKIIVEEGKLTVRVRTSFIFGTASDNCFKDEDIQMLLSRCFCVNISMSFEEAMRLKKYGRKINLDRYKIPKEPIDLVILPEKENEYLIEKMQEVTMVGENYGGYYTRCHDDMIRISAISCVLRGNKVIDRKDVDKALSFYKLHQLGFLGTQLSDTELSVYELCNGLSVSDIANKLRISERTVRRAVKKLMEIELIYKADELLYKRI